MMPSSKPIRRYLDELCRAAKGVDFAAIVIGYERQTRFVWSMGSDPAAKLKALMDSGGKPMAILGASVIGNAFLYSLIPFPEYEECAGVQAYLEAIGEEVTCALAERLQASLN